VAAAHEARAHRLLHRDYKSPQGEEAQRLGGPEVGVADGDVDALRRQGDHAGGQRDDEEHEVALRRPEGVRLADEILARVQLGEAREEHGPDGAGAQQAQRGDLLRGAVQADLVVRPEEADHERVRVLDDDHEGARQREGRRQPQVGAGQLAVPGGEAHAVAPRPDPGDGQGQRLGGDVAAHEQERLLRDVEGAVEAQPPGPEGADAGDDLPAPGQVRQQEGGVAQQQEDEGGVELSDGLDAVDALLPRPRVQEHLARAGEDLHHDGQAEDERRGGVGEGAAPPRRP
jgi:hypothetical protein